MKITPYHILVLFRIVFSIVLTYILFRYFGSESGFKNFGILWIITYPIILIVIIGNLLLNFKQVPKALKYYNSLLLLVFLVFLFLPERMEKGVILEAHLNEERSSWNIKIFENNNYRVRRSDLGGFKDYEGRYILVNDTLKIERFECNQCNFTNEWILGDKKLIPLNSNSENCYGCFEIVYRK
ncbi:hypothetical protein LV84_00188 [Algoriphagus ratkowskyi]|uniref:Uncharacterized protein n=1 Tax=Algoriphagus ratkowskyi TaxID=57028 RepID=A0A2W7RRQ4_9BACT|nr:hypothetical protein [Algoriphagus ratkowskyi]PZX61200.1 hypothetical protein LV84_00188 [Algoriphagus ratkowskyi]TXD79320.1 hypothetical protein ESW18_03565 [Algoriphagus ratkowskyi]